MVMGLGPHPEPSGTALNLLRNKRSVKVDTRAAGTRELLLALAETCDVVITALRSTAIESLGIGYRDVREVRPDIIYCQAQGYPLDSDRAEEPAYDDVIQAST